MQKTLSPVIDKDAYSELLVPELQDWLYDVIFGPLFWALRDSGVELDDEAQGIRFDEYGKEKLDREERANEVDWTPFPEELRSLGIPRRDMPQIKGPVRSALYRHLESKGVGRIEEELIPGDLRPAQAGYWPAKLESAMERLGKGDRPILVSRDHFVLDGHHQWFAAALNAPNRPIRVVRFLAGIKHLIPMANSMPSAERAAAETSALRAALSSGRIWYADGVFGTDSGFSAAISRELRAAGARFDSSKGVFLLPPNSIPLNLKSAIDQAQARAAEVHEVMLATLAEALPNVAAAPVGLKLGAQINRVLRDLDAQFDGSVKGIEAISVSPDLQPAVREAISKGLTENLELYVKNFAVEEIPELRKMIEANLRSGARLDRLSEIVEARFGVAKRKAEFLARQESSLFTAKFRMERAKNIGSTQYIWRTRNDQRVRDGHAALEGTLQMWDHPPIEDPKRGTRANPGESFGCRCFAVPVIQFPKREKAA